MEILVNFEPKYKYQCHLSSSVRKLRNTVRQNLDIFKHILKDKIPKQEFEEQTTQWPKEKGQTTIFNFCVVFGRSLFDLCVV